MFEHLKLVEAFRPNVFECLCDSASSVGCKLKRIRKSVDRSLKFLDDTISERETNQVQKMLLANALAHLHVL